MNFLPEIEKNLTSSPYNSKSATSKSRYKVLKESDAVLGIEFKEIVGTAKALGDWETKMIFEKAFSGPDSTLILSCYKQVPFYSTFCKALIENYSTPYGKKDLIANQHVNLIILAEKLKNLELGKFIAGAQNHLLYISSKLDKSDPLLKNSKIANAIKILSAKTHLEPPPENDAAHNVSIEIKDALHKVESLFRQLQLGDDHLELLKDYISGKEVFLQDGILDKVLEDLYENALNHSKRLVHLQDSHKDTTAISPSMIRSESTLFRAERVGKAWAKEQIQLHTRDKVWPRDPLRIVDKEWVKMQDGLQSHKKSANMVYELKGSDESPNDISGYFKQIYKGESHSAIMETLMWDLSCILGAYEYFTPTKETVIHTSRDFTKDGENSAQYYEGGDIVKREHANKGRSGSLQIPEFPRKLSDYIKNPDGSVSLFGVIQGTLITLIFGMWDAHPKNMIVDAEGLFKFFDNTRSLPSSNTFIHRGNGHIVPYRSGLLQLKESYEDLGSSEIDMIFKIYEVFNTRLPIAIKYLRSEAVQLKLEKLPAGWFNTEHSIEAMTHRLRNLEQALTLNNFKNLRDLILRVVPDIKFQAALMAVKVCIDQKFLPERLRLISEPHILEIQKLSFSSMCFSSIEELLRICIDNFIDPKTIFNLAAKDDLPFEGLIHKVCLLYANKQIPSLEKEEMIVKNQLSILKKIARSSRIDFKDNTDKECRTFASHIIMEMLDEVGLRDNCELRSVSGQDFIKFKYISVSGLVEVLILDFLTVPGKIIIKHCDGEFPPMTAKEFKNFVSEPFSFPERLKEWSHISLALTLLKQYNLPLHVLKPLDVKKYVKNLPHNSQIIVQIKGSETPRFQYLHKDARGVLQKHEITITAKPITYRFNGHTFLAAQFKKWFDS